MIPFPELWVVDDDLINSDQSTVRIVRLNSALFNSDINFRSQAFKVSATLQAYSDDD
jgi:hypothetical protein